MSVWNLLSTFTTALFGNMVGASNRYTPSFQDILEVKQILIERGALPLEIVDTIIDFAEYWIKTTTCRTRGQVSVRAGGEFEESLLVSWQFVVERFHANKSIAEILSPWLHPHERQPHNLITYDRGRQIPRHTLCAMARTW
jgi:hypothetical protein